MASTSDEREPSAEGYEPPEVEEVSTEAGPAVTAAGDTPVDGDEAIRLIEEDE